MRHIIRATYRRPNLELPMLIQGDVVDDYVDPSTVRVWALWENYAGKEIAGAELIPDPDPESESESAKKLRMRSAVYLTKILRNNDDSTTTT